MVRGSIYERQGQTAKALLEYDAAVRANGSDTQARAGIASLAMRTGQIELARPQFEALLAMGYRPGRMHFGLGQVAERKGDKQTAIGEYRLALQAEPGLPEARAALARLGAQR